MDFGRVSKDELSSIDFKLVEDPSFNQKILSENSVVNILKVYVGCAKWGKKEWIGKIYPPGIKESNFLDEYVKHYNSIELNATHYQIYPPLTIKKWADKAKEKDFLFCPKITNSISHEGKLTDKYHLTTQYLEGIKAFGNHLGPIFLQLSEMFSPDRLHELIDYLQSLPKTFQFFLEVRHPGFFSDKHIRELLCITLHQLNIGAVITDTAGRRDCAHMYLTVPKTFIRFVGNSLHTSDFTRIDDWVKRIKYWLDNGLKELYFFMHMHDEATSPELSVYLIEQLNNNCNLKLSKPRFIPSLF